MLLVSILFLYLLTSCGQPSYHDYSNEISVSKSNSYHIGGEFYDAGFRVHVDSNLIGLGGSTPSILLMYCISPSTDSLSNYFNQYIRGTNNYYNGATATFNSNGELDNVVGNYEGEELHLYAFKGANQLPLSSSPSYTVSIPLDIGERAQYYFIMVRRSGEDSANRFHLILDCYAGDSYSGSDARKVCSKNLYRYPGGSNSQFFRNTDDLMKPSIPKQLLKLQKPPHAAGPYHVISVISFRCFRRSSCADISSGVISGLMRT